MPDIQRWRAAILLVALVANGFAVPCATSAQGAAALRFRVTRDARGCITEPRLRARVGRWLVEGEPSQDLIVELDGARQEPTLQVSRGDAVIAARTFDVLPPGCADRVAAIALVIAVALEHAGAQPEERGTDALNDEARRVAPTEGRSAATPKPGAQATPASAAPKPEGATPVPGAPRPGEQAAEESEERVETEDSEAAPANDAAPRWLAHAGGGVAVGIVPQPTWLAELGLGVQLAALRFEVAALITGENGGELGTGSVREQLFGGRAHGCVGRAFGLLDGEACAGLLAGIVTAQGSGLDDSRSTSMALVAPIVRFALRMPARGRFSVRAAITGFLPVVRPTPRFVREDGSDERPSAAAGLLATLAFVATIP